MQKKHFRIGIIPQIAILFLLGITAIGVITYFSQRELACRNVRKQTLRSAENTAQAVSRSVREYPAHQWLIRYWFEHWDALDIEYDAEFESGTATEEKCRLFLTRHPDILPEYASVSEIEALPEEDQKLYAEIAYSWMITRLNQIKRSQNVSFLFCVVTDEPYDEQFFLFSAADEGAVRGTAYEEVYTLGKTVSVGESQQQAMRDALEFDHFLAEAGDYVDYYGYLDTFDGHDVLIGLTYNLSELNADVRQLTLHEASLSVALLAALAMLCLLMLYLAALRPLKKVQRNIRRYKETKDSSIVAASLARIHSGNEIHDLSDDVVDLTKEIDDHLERIESITAEKERIGTELELARRIQENMLPNTFPPFPDRPEFDIYASMNPAKEIGGDFYDFFLVDDDHLCLVIADVAGKGIPAALVMMVSKILLKNHAMGKKTPAEVLKVSNYALSANNAEDMFLTVWIGILEISTGRLTAANAGHEYPVIRKPGGSFELLKDRHSFVLGAMEHTPFHEYELQLKPGSGLFLYTDGVPEATSSKKELFGTDRMLAALNRDPAAAPAAVLANVDRAVDEFVRDAEQFDDLTMLCLTYNGPKGADGRNDAE